MVRSLDWHLGNFPPPPRGDLTPTLCYQVKPLPSSPPLLGRPTLSPKIVLTYGLGSHSEDLAVTLLSFWNSCEQVFCPSNLAVFDFILVKLSLSRQNFTSSSSRAQVTRCPSLWSLHLQCHTFPHSCRRLQHCKQQQSPWQWWWQWPG